MMFGCEVSAIPLMTTGSCRHEWGTRRNGSSTRVLSMRREIPSAFLFLFALCSFAEAQLPTDGAVTSTSYENTYFNFFLFLARFLAAI